MLPAISFWSQTRNVDAELAGDQTITGMMRQTDLFRLRRSLDRHKIGCAFVKERSQIGPGSKFPRLSGPDKVRAFQVCCAVTKDRRNRRVWSTLINQPLRVINLQRRLIRPIMGQIYASLAYSPQCEDFAWEVWRRLTESVTKSQTCQEGIRIWKAFGLWLRDHFGGNVSKTSPNPFPDLPANTWLVKDPRELDLDEIRSLTMLSGSRGTPSGDRNAMRAALEKTLEISCRRPDPVAESELDEIRRISRICGEEIRNCCDFSLNGMNFHTSMSNTACIEMKVTDGGKTSYLLREFHRKFLMEISDGEYYVLPCGIIIDEIAGQQRWKARISGVDDAPDIPFGEEIPNSGWYHPELSGCNPTRLGIMLHYWSYRELLLAGYIQPDGKPSGKPIPAKMSPIGEPGGKVRVVQVTLCALTTYLQPYAHVMNAVLSCDPTLRAGLTAAYQAFEYSKRVKNIDFEFILSGDLEDSTNHFQWQVVREHAKSFNEGFSRGEELTDYFRNAPELLCSPFSIEFEGDTYVTANGNPMGLPGTKIMLHTLSKCFDIGGSGRTSALSFKKLQSHPWQCAGDDVVKLSNSYQELEKLGETADLYKVKRSEEKWGIFNIRAPFCETPIDLKSVGGHTSANHIDIVKSRLLSPEVKSTQGDDDTNPIYGKAQQFSTEVSWAGWNSVALRKIFRHNFQDHIEGNDPLGMPRWIGGWELAETEQESFDLVSETVKKGCLKVMRLVQDHKILEADRLKQILSRLTRRATHDRGAEIVDNDHAGPIAELLAEFLPTMSLNDILLSEGLREEAIAKMRHVDKHKSAISKGYLPIFRTLRTPCLLPYWKRRMDKRSRFTTTTWRKRLQQVEDLLHDHIADMDSVTLDEWKEVLTYDGRSYLEEVYYLRDDLNVFIEDDPAHVENLNLESRDCGFSLRIAIPNKTLLFSQITSEEGIEPRPPKLRRTLSA